MATALITRAEAHAQGLKRYFTGQPCAAGHIAERYVSSYMCSACCVEILQKRYKDNPDKERARAKQLRHLDPEKARATSAKYRRSNPEKRRAAVKRWRAANPDKVREMARRARLKRDPAATEKSRRKWLAVPENKASRSVSIKAWRAANPDKSRAITRNRRARIAGAQGAHTAADLKEILEAQGHRCAYCRADLRKTAKHVDHIVPLARGGSNGRANLQYLCAPCNQAKNAKDPADFARSIGLLL